MCKLVVDQEPEFCLRPDGYAFVSVLVVVVTSGVVVGTSLFAGMSNNEIAFIVFGGSFAGLAVAGLLFGIHRREQLFGPYVIGNREGLHRRSGRRVSLADFTGFDVIRRWEPTGDGDAKYSVLIIKCVSGERIELVKDPSLRRISRLALAMERRIVQMQYEQSHSHSRHRVP